MPLFEFRTSKIQITASSILGQQLVVTLMEFDTSGGHFGDQIMAIYGEGHD